MIFKQKIVFFFIIINCTQIPNGDDYKNAVRENPALRALDRIDDFLSTHELRVRLPEELQSSVGQIKMSLTDHQDAATAAVQQGRSEYSVLRTPTGDGVFRGFSYNNKTHPHPTAHVRFSRPRFRPENRHPVPVGTQVQDDRADTDRHRRHRAENVESPDPGTPVVGLVRRHGHLQVHQAQGGRRRDPALPVAGARAPPRRIRPRQGVQRTATGRRRVTTSEHTSRPRPEIPALSFSLFIMYLYC